MSRFKQLWSSFWRKDQGLGMIETALLLPIFLMFAFAVIDFGNFMIVKNRIVSANQTIASAIQNNPTMTTGGWGSATDLQSVIQNTLGNLWNKNGTYIGHTGVAIWPSKTVPIIGDIPNYGVAEMWLNRNIKNPWLSDSDPSNDNNAYYVGVYVMRGVPWVTPLPKMLGLNGVADIENMSGDAPHGRKITDSFSFVTLNDTTCPAGEVLERMTGRAATCVPRDHDYSCPPGQVLQNMTKGAPTCVAKDNNYGCPSNQVLQSVTNGAPTCVDKNLDLRTIRSRHKDAEWGNDGKGEDCPNGSWVMGFSCTGDCSGNNMKVKCAKIELENP